MDNEREIVSGNANSNIDTSGIAKTVERIMKNPELAGIINELRGGEENAPQVSQTEILSHLPEVMSMLKPLVGGEPSREQTETEDKKTESVTVKPDKIKPKKYDKGRAEKLMAALKPYLNPNRCEIIDKCVSVIQITDVVEALHGLEGLTKPEP